MRCAKVCVVLLVGFFATQAYGQAARPDTVLVIGQVLEEESYSGLPFAHVRVGEKATTTDFKGIFKVRVDPADTIFISYVGYKTAKLTLPETLSRPMYETKVILKKDTILLGDANITILPSSVEAFKQAVLSLDLSEQEYRNVRRNMEAMARQMTVYNYEKYSMDAAENQRASLSGPQGFNILGVLKKLKSALVPEATPEQTPATPVYYEPSYLPDSLIQSDTIFLQRPDSTLRVNN